MGPREDFLALFNGLPTQKARVEKPLAHLKERLSKEHEEMMRLLNNEEAITRELTKKIL